MPELPEVEAARRAIQDHCVGKKIRRSVVDNDSKVIDGVTPSDFEAALLGKTIVAAHRKGKNMWIQLDSPPFPTFQFGMAGAIYIKGVAVTKYKRSAVNDTDEWPSKYSKVFIELDDGLELSFTDKRRFAKVRLLENPVSVPPISELGPDALLEPMVLDDFFKSLSKKKIGIKALLLDQSYISGIGNWIADEVLYQAKIHPQQSASSLSRESCETLSMCIKEVVEKAVEVGADSSEFPTDWIFHSREKKPGKAFVDGKEIEFITAGGRTTAYVPEIQKLPVGQVAKVSTKPNKGTKKTKDAGIEEDEEAKSVEAKARNTPRQGRKKAVLRKKTDTDSEDDADSDEEGPKQKKGGGKKAPNMKTRGGKRPPPKRKSKEDDGDDTDDDDDNEIDDDDSDDTDKKNQKQRNVKKVESGKKANKRAK